MPSIYAIKPLFQKMLRPFCAGVHCLGITPNQITVATLLASFGMGAWLYAGKGAVAPYLALPLFLFLRMAANAIDGMIAKEHNLCSPTGALLNEIGDVLADAALYLPFAILPGVQPALVVAVVVLAAVSELAGTAALGIGARRRFDGPMGKSDRALMFGAAGLVYGLGGMRPLSWNLLLGGIAGLLLLTIFNRCRNAVRERST